MSKYSMSATWSDEDNCYIATVKEFPGLSAFGETRSEAIKQAEIALEGFMKVYQEDGCELPEPETVKQYSGQTRIRLPKSLHAALSNEADSEGVSLNSLIISLLSERHYIKRIEKDLSQIMACMQLQVFGSALQETGASSDVKFSNFVLLTADNKTESWVTL
ncbi:MAG: toxin-antitoxin system HicB family antitoxin [Chlamydiales bacterium]|nr:toxin-antitoxin system HicB family antitoxin [Chlamydiales bacterium]